MIQKMLYRVGQDFVVGAANKSELLAKEAQQAIAKQKVSKFTFGTPSKKTFSFGQKSVEQQKMFEEGVGQQIIADQNRAMINKSSWSFGKKELKPENQMHYLTLLKNPTLAQQRFKSETGANLHIGNNFSLVGNSFGFDEGLQYLENWYKQGLIPNDIKHVLIGHGTGSAEKGSWAFWNGNKAIGNVFDYINTHIPKGEKVLVMTCEGGTNTLAKPGIGTTVATNLLYASNPAKIVKSGDNKIIGHFFNPTAIENGKVVGGATYY